MRVSAIVASLLVALTAAWDAVAAPAISFTHLPAWESTEDLEGLVTGADPASHHVAVYLRTDTGGWWTKPSFSSPETSIQPDGSFITDVTTGGDDTRATVYAAHLLAITDAAPLAMGETTLPASLEAISLASAEAFRGPVTRTVTFAGRTWEVKESIGSPLGPGPNWFSASPEAVWVDGDGLHLTITNYEGRWWSSEVVLQESLGHGTYVFQTDTNVDALDPNIVVGLFTWDPFGDWMPGGSANDWPWREIDFEYARWGNGADPTNAQMVIQPYYVSGNLVRYTVPDLTGDTALTSFFDWEPTQIDFTTYLGHDDFWAFPASAEVFSWSYAHDPGMDHWVPDEGRENIRFNLWLVGGSAPQNGQPAEVVISDFQYYPPGVPAELTILQAD